MPSNITDRNADTPSLNVEYSALQVGEDIRKRSNAAYFEVNSKSLVFCHTALYNVWSMFHCMDLKPVHPIQPKLCVVFQLKI